MTNAELIAELRSHIREVPLTLLHAAADALEAAEQRIAELDAQNVLKDGTITAMATDIGKLRAQMPKEGEWIDEQRGRWIYAKCNLCGKVQDVRSNYCPNCGARMTKGEDK